MDVGAPILLEQKVKEGQGDSMLAPKSGREMSSAAILLVTGGRQWLAPQSYLRGVALMPLQRQGSLLFLSWVGSLPMHLPLEQKVLPGLRHLLRPPDSSHKTMKTIYHRTICCAMWCSIYKGNLFCPHNLEMVASIVTILQPKKQGWERLSHMGNKRPGRTPRSV